MATLEAAIQIHDRMSNVINSIANSLNICISSFEAMQSATSKGVDTSGFSAARGEMTKVGADLVLLEEQIQKFNGAAIAPQVVQPVWQGSTEIEVFKNTGIERFTQEINSAQLMIDQLAQTQRNIINQAHDASIIPVNAENDLRQLNSRITAIGATIANLENIPINLRTDRANNMIENLRGQLNGAIGAQNDLNTAIGRMDLSAANTAYQRLDNTINGVERNIREANAAQQQLNNSINQGQSEADGLMGKIKSVVGAYAGIAAIKGTISSAKDWLDLTNIRIGSEKQLAVVMQNMGAIRDEYESIRKTAAQLQGTTIYSSDLFIAGAAELATYLKSGSAIESMMGTLANYAAGMSGGGEIDKRAMVEYATQLGKALDGNFQGLKMKGFEPTEWEKKILQVGDEMQKVAVIQGIIARSWDGLAEAITNTPQGQLIQMKNTWDGIKESVGTYLYPYVLDFFTALNTNMPLARSMMFGFATAIAMVISGLSVAADVGGGAATFIMNNWSFIGPVVWGVVAALMAYHGTQLAANSVTLISKGLHIAMAAAQMIHAAATGGLTAATAAQIAAQYGLNAALYACPITWVIIGIIAIVAVFYLAVAAVNYFAGTSYSATGLIVGYFYMLYAFVMNIIAYMANGWISFAEFFVNVWHNPIYAVQKLFVNLGNNILNIIKTIANAIDAVFGSNLSTGITNLQSRLNAQLGAMPDNYKVLAKMEMTNLNDAFSKGYDIGNSLGDKFKFNNSGLPDSWQDGMAKGMADTAANTKGIKDAMGILDEDLKYLRDIADREYINQTSYSTVKIDMSGMTTTINNKGDLDGLEDSLATRLQEKMSAAAEGVHV